MRSDEFGGEAGIDHKVVRARVLDVQLEDYVFSAYASFGELQSRNKILINQ
jgi:hypothetical protein